MGKFINNYCELLHRWFNKTKRFKFPFNGEINFIPENGIYILFEKGEKYKNWDRIVRVGTHTGQNQLRSRLNQHFVKKNKDRSIFRKNIGRCFLNKQHNPYLEIWEFDTTSKEAKKKYENKINKEFEKRIERRISEYIQKNLSFTVFEVKTKEERLFWESKIVSTLSWNSDFKPSNKWLGLFSPKNKIRESGLWQVNELYKEPFNKKEILRLGKMLKCV